MRDNSNLGITNMFITNYTTILQSVHCRQIDNLQNKFSVSTKT
jgi:hypothetical protein